MDHNGKGINSHLLKHHIEKELQCLQNKDFVIISSGFWNNTVKRKISKVLWIRDLRPTLNRQERSIELKLFKQGRVLVTVKNSAVNTVFSIRPTVELPNLYLPKTQ